MNTHASLFVQYLHYLGDIATGNFGTSLYFYPASVSSVVRAALPWTLGLVGVTTILAFVLGTGVGHRLGAGGAARWLDGVLPPVFVITSAIPYFWVAMMFILIFGIRLQWLP